MKRNNLYHLIFLLVIICSCQQKQPQLSDSTHSNDSIEKYLSLAANDTLAFSKRNLYNNKAYSFIDLTKEDTKTLNYIYKTSISFYSFNEPIKLKKGASILYFKSKKKKDIYRQALSLKLFGLYYMLISNNEKALEYFFRSKKIFISLKKQGETIKVLEAISLTQYYAGDFLGSNKTAFDILKLNRKLQIKDIDVNCYMQIGNNLSSLKLENQAIKYYNKIDIKNCNKSLKNIVINNISSSYIILKQYQKGLNILNEILKDTKYKKNNPNIYFTTQSLYSYCKLKMNILDNLPEDFNRVESLFKKNNCISGRNYNQIYLSEYYEKTNNKIKAIQAAQKGLELSKNYKNTNDQLICYKQLIAVDPAKAAHYAKIYIQLNDSLQQVERNFRDKFAQIVFETDRISKEKEKAELQKWYILGISFIISTFILMLYIINIRRNKKKEDKLMQIQREANNEIYQLTLVQKLRENEARQNEKNRIAQELHDGVLNKLISIRLNLNAIQQNCELKKEKPCLHYITNLHEVEKEIRNISHNLNQSDFNKNISQFEVLHEIIEEQNKLTSTNYILELDPDLNWDNVSVAIKLHLFRIIQEAINNINKHAQAKKAIISLVIDERKLGLSIMDYGKGFDTNQKSKGIGIKNIKKRVETLNGKITIQSQINQFTTLNIIIPL